MKSNYKRLGNYIKEVNIRNRDLKATELLGINIDKFFMPSVANTVGTDLSAYKIVHQNQFACNRMHVGRDYRIPIALSNKEKPFMVSPAYDVFEIINPKALLPEYLMMWFSRKEFDRNAWFYTDADVRGGLPWKAFCDMQLPIPSPEKQREIVAEYNAIQSRIALNNSLIQKLEEAAQAIYKHWFGHGDDANKVSLGQYIITNPSLSIKKGKLSPYVEMNDLTTTSMGISGKVEREFNGGSKFQNGDTLLARITPCLENGKTAFVDILEPGQIGAGSTEFIVMRAKKDVSPYWVYCLARDEDFRAFAISTMVGSSGRERVDEKYLIRYELGEIQPDRMLEFHKTVEPLFKLVHSKHKEVANLLQLKNLLLSKLATIETSKHQLATA